MCFEFKNPESPMLPLDEHRQPEARFNGSSSLLDHRFAAASRIALS